MVLDPELVPIAEFVREVPPIRTMSWSQAHALEKAMQGALVREKEAVARVEDGTVAGREREIPIRTYLPFGEAAGTVVFYHGGGFMLGSIETHDQLCRQLTNASGCRVVSVEYRLAPTFKFPTGLSDCYDVPKWALQSFLNRVAVAGDSAGGNFATVVSQLAKKDKLPGPRFQALMCPVPNFVGIERSFVEFAEGPVLTTDDIKYFHEQYLTDQNDASDPMVSPLLSESFAGLPPALVVTAKCDLLRDQGEMYSALLRKAGVSVLGLRYTGMTHGFMSFPIKASVSAIHDVGFAIRDALRAEQIAMPD